MNDEMNISVCGNYCHLCPAYIGEKGTLEDRQKGSAAWERYFGLHFKPEAVRCRGCQSNEPWKTGNILPSRMCGMRACAKHNAIPTCAHCAQFPCPEFSKRTPGAELRQQREKASGTKFTEQEYKENIEPFEGRLHLAALRKTLQPAEIKPAKPGTQGKIFIDFPSKTSLPPAKEKSLKDLRALLSILFNPIAPTFVEQNLLERRLPCTAALLWSLSLYGEFKDAHLVMDSKTCKDKKECTRFIRKTDNQLHGTVQEAVTNLAQFGLVIQFTPMKKEWQLTLKAQENAGGRPALEALAYYVNTLAAKYGQPVYVNSYNLKGKAFKLFSKLDMRNI